MDVTTKTTEAVQQVVIFSVAEESYGVDIGMVSEIIRLQEITKVPRTPTFVVGVINLRGKIIPVVSLRTIFHLPAAEQTRESRIVVVDIGGQQTGVMVDAVTEVLRIAADAVEPPSSVIAGADSDYLLGIAKVGDKMITLLNLEKVLSREQAAKFAQMDFNETDQICLETQTVS